MRRTPLQILTALAFATFLSAPFWLLLAHIGGAEWNWNGEVRKVLIFTVAQAAASAVASMSLAFPAALGLLSIPPGSNRLRWSEGLYLLPTLVPGLVTIFSVTKLWSNLVGWSGIVFVHALINSGLLAVVMARVFREKLGALSELAYVESAGFLLFWRKGALTYLRGDLLRMSLAVFAVCFASFAVPLMIGGSRGTTLELLIYQKLRLDSAWNSALSLALAQAGFLLLATLFLRDRVATSNAACVSPLLQWRPGLLLGVGPAAIVIFGLLTGAEGGWAELKALPQLVPMLGELLLNSFFVSISVGAATIGLMAVIAYIYPRASFRRFLLGYAAPSAVLTGFALLIAWRGLGLATYCKIVLGCVLLFLPGFYRLQMDSLLTGLRGQVAVAETLGASPGLIFRQITWPQIAESIYGLAALAAFWAWGDFSISSIVAERNLTLALYVRALMESYRLAGATLLLYLLLLAAGVTYFLFRSLHHVAGQRPQT